MSRQHLRHQGEAMVQTLFGLPTQQVGLGNLLIEAGCGVGSRPGLARRHRALVAIAGFTALRLAEQVARFGQSSLNIGLIKAAVSEAVTQTALLTGFPPALNSLGTIGAGFVA